MGESSGDYFGAPIILNGDGSRLIVSGTWNGANGDLSGHARIYEFQSDNWVQLGQDIDGDDDHDQLGWSIDINQAGNRIIVSSRHEFTNSSGTFRGDARVFELQSGDWVPLGDFITGPPNLPEYFGYKVSMNTAGNVVAATLRSWEGYSGLTRVFQLIGGNWEQVGNDIVGNPGEVASEAVALNAQGNRIAVGAPGYDEGGIGNLGIVRIYELTGNSWTQLGQGIIGEGVGDEIGNSFDFNAIGNILVSGEPLNDNVHNNAGQVRVFELQSGNWIQLGNPLIGVDEDDMFGWNVSINAVGDQIGIVKVLERPTKNNIGEVGVFQLESNTWQPFLQPLHGNNVGDGFGNALSLNDDGDFLATSAINIGPNDSGIAYVYVNDEILSIVENNDSRTELYPNPNHGNFSINLGSTYSEIEMVILNIDGRKIYSQKYNNVDSLSCQKELQSGMYFVILSSENKSIDRIKMLID